MPIDIKLPEVGEGIESGTVVGVLVKIGDHVVVDQPILELETDKAVVEVPASAEGVVEAIHVQVGATARIGAVVLTLATAGSEPAAAPAAAVPTAAPAGSAPAATPVAAAPAPAPTAPMPAPAALAPTPVAPPTAPIPAAPSVRRLARELGVDVRSIAGSGPLGRISADDVQRHLSAPAPALAAPAAAPAPALPDFSRYGETERVPMSGIRKATVRSMTQAWSTVPMVTHFDEADVTEFEALRARYKAVVERAGAKLTPTAMLLKVVAGALRRFPDFNASIDTASQEIVYKRYVHIGTAVDTEHGLLVPVIRHADRKSVTELAVELQALAERARARKLTPDDMSGGNFSVSNLGGIGGTGFTPIVAPPDVAILGVSRSAIKPVWNAASGAFEPRSIMPLALSYDHRLIDGAAAARFLRWICRAIEEPYLLTLEG